MNAAKALFLSGEITGMLLRATPEDFAAAAQFPGLEPGYAEIVLGLAELRGRLPATEDSRAVQEIGR